MFDSSLIKNDAIKIKNLKVEVEKIKNRFPQKPLLVIANKIDALIDSEIQNLIDNLKPHTTHLLPISAKIGQGIEELQTTLLDFVNTGALKNNDTIITNSRHYDALLKALEEINKVQDGLNANLPSDLMAIDIRQALFHFGEITGQVTNDELLGNIFANFCIGK